VGGWKLASLMRVLGFDVFDDLVDHSYETMAEPMDRAYYAIERNLALLRDHERVSRFVADNQARFEHNLQLLKTNPFLHICIDRLQHCTESEQAEIRTIIHTYRNGVLNQQYQCSQGQERPTMILPPGQKGW
jgi:hypothetical protein